MIGRRATLLFMVAAAIIAAVLTVLSPPAFIASLFAEELPSPVAGDPVPAIIEKPTVRIAVAGDAGTGDNAEQATAQRMVAESWDVPYDVLLLLGDLIYEEGDAALVDSAVLEPFARLIDSGTELIPVLGNHDYQSGEQQQILTELGQTKSWYAVRVGPVLLVVLDSNRVDDLLFYDDHIVGRAIDQQGHLVDNFAIGQ